MTVAIAADSPLAEYGTWFESSLLSSNRSKHTRDVYLAAVKHFDIFLAANAVPRDLPKIKRTHVEAFMHDQLSRCKPATAAARYGGLRAFFKWAASEGEIAESPMEKMRPPTVPEPEIKSLSDDEVDRLLKAAEGLSFRQRRDMALMRFMLDTGVRRAEAAAIKLADLDIEHRYAKVVKGKGSKDRIVAFSPPTQQALFRYLRLREKQPKGSSPFLWLGRGGAMSPDAVGEIVVRRSVKAGVTDHDGSPVHAHMLRHTWASTMKAAGFSEENLMELGGWANSDMLHRYGRDQRRLRAIDAAQAFFAGERVTA